nr:3-deoxy-7-phosphoheptulonate synthase class II [Micromonospora pisi]
MECHSLPVDSRVDLVDALARPAAQQPTWGNQERAREICSALRDAPPIVTVAEVERLRRRLTAVARGRAFLLQGGDCAETFADSTEDHVRGNLRALSRMAATIAAAGGPPVVRLGRMAGQYAKPRSSETDPSGLPAYRGDMINSLVPTREAREHEPFGMIRAYLNAAAAMEYVREEVAVEPMPTYPPLRYDGAGPAASSGGLHDRHADDADLNMPEICVSHEALVLDYESAMLRLAGAGRHAKLYDLSAHFLWVGERTRQPMGAHLAFAELIANPIGLKIGPGVTPAAAAEYVERLDPSGTPGRLTLISRMGHARIRDVLPPVVERVAATGHEIVWQCDPMHGNTETSSNGYKTRYFEHIVDEVEGFFEVHRALGTYPGGLHVEITGEDVTECLGGSQNVVEADLPRRYRTACDPRLNYRQAQELASVVAGLLARETVYLADLSSGV